ncbi:MAG: hypothetical protein K6T85_06610 [Gorillibacterium sp.]|nr:hypothetical protein [Gorillibacterium sp.]
MNEVAATNIQELEKRVSKWMDGPYGRIGIIMPDHPATKEELSKLHDDVARVLYQAAKRKALL